MTAQPIYVRAVEEFRLSNSVEEIDAVRVKHRDEVRALRESEPGTYYAIYHAFFYYRKLIEGGLSKSHTLSIPQPPDIQPSDSRGAGKN